MKTIFIILLLLLFFFHIPFAQTEFSQQQALQFLKILSVDIGPRPMGSPNEQRALKFAVDKFKSFGCDTAYLMPMTFTARANTNSGIAIGVIKGIYDRIIVIGAHLDTQSPETPGANDNGSGCAVVLELARLLAKRKPQSTIMFTLFGGEEQGLRGSQYFTDYFTALDSVVLMIQVDMANGDGILEIDPHTYKKSAPKWLVKAAIDEYNMLGYENLRYPTHALTLNYAFGGAAGSDHEPFLSYGIPAIAFISDLTGPIHTPQDNIKNFKPSGLKRSGDLVLKLVERFDSGVPDRVTEQYWLLLIGKTPVFLPLWVLSILIIISIIASIVAFIVVRQRRLVVAQSSIIDSETNKPLPNPRKWTGLKMLLYTIITILFAWFATELMGIIKGFRFPWYSDVQAYFILSVLFGLVGLWISFRIEKKLRLTKCPYILIKSSLLILWVLVIGFSACNISLGIYPAGALLFLSLAVLIRVQVLKIISFVIAVFIMFRLIFNEWLTFGLRTYANITILDFSTQAFNILINLMSILFLIVITIPFFFGFGAVLRETPMLNSLLSKFKSAKTLFYLMIIITSLSVYLYMQPTYNEVHQRSVQVLQSYNINTKELSIKLASNEYLDSIKIKHYNIDTILTAKNIKSSILPIASFDTSGIKFVRVVKKIKSNDTTYFDINLRLESKITPYKINIDYYGNNNFRSSLLTDWKFQDINEKISFEWYSFPKMPLSVPLKFFIVGEDSLKEITKVTYADLLYPMELFRENTNFIKRTIVEAEFNY